MRLIFDSAPKNVLVENGREIHGGNEFTVTDGRGDELLAQHGVAVKLAASNDLTREELNDAAKAAGVDDPESLPNKTAVIEAVNHDDESSPAVSETAKQSGRARPRA